MALYPDLTVLQGSIRKLETAPQIEPFANEENGSESESDYEDDLDYVSSARLDGESQGILPFVVEPPQLPQKLIPPQLPPKLTSAVFAAPPPDVYASVTPRSKRESGITPQSMNSTCAKNHQGNAVKQFQTYGEFMNNGQNSQHQFGLTQEYLNHRNRVSPNQTSQNTNLNHQVNGVAASRNKKPPVPKPRKIVKRSPPAVPEQNNTTSSTSSSSTTVGAFTTTVPAPAITTPSSFTSSSTAADFPVTPDVVSSRTEAVATFQDDDLYGARAPGKQAIIHWFNNTQSHSIKDKTTSVIPPWFHGLITRDEAESRLENEAIGTFLMRFSETRFGYSLSIRAEDKIRHYMIDEDKKHKKYLIVNEDASFNTLQDLVDHYKKNDVSTWQGKLTKACGEGDQHVVYDNRTGIRKRVEKPELPDRNVPVSGISPSVVTIPERTHQRPPRSVDRSCGPPPLPTGRRGAGRHAVRIS